jgi:hypothetical protein
MTEHDSAPRRIGNALLIYKTIMGVVGGMTGTVILIIIALMGNWLFPTLFDGLDAESAPKSPLLLFLVLVMVFLATIIGNLVTVTLLSIVDRTKYTHLSTSLTQGFLFNLLIFIFSIPIYLFLQSASLSTISFVVGIHLVLTAFMTSTVMEILSRNEHILVSLYGNTLGMMVTLAVNLVSFMVLSNSAAKALFMFLVFPIVWTCLGLFQSAAEMLYRWMYDVYGTDFLSIKAVYETRVAGSVEEGTDQNEGETLQ